MNLEILQLIASTIVFVWAAIMYIISKNREAKRMPIDYKWLYTALILVMMNIAVKPVAFLIIWCQSW